MKYLLPARANLARPQQASMKYLLPAQANLARPQQATLRAGSCMGTGNLELKSPVVLTAIC